LSGCVLWVFAAYMMSLKQTMSVQCWIFVRQQLPENLSANFSTRQRFRLYNFYILV